jgi:hypothetical protein
MEQLDFIMFVTKENTIKVTEWFELINTSELESYLKNNAEENFR